ncbi:MAG: hypothetical protein JO250_05335 [Armatimonadetes bacterium]|nr:hypothetical protein [Armatimonadota bacterium]
MAHEPLQTTLQDFIAEAEQAHRFFQTECHDTRGTTRAALAQMELIQFYGQAFAQMVRLLAQDPLRTDALEEAVRGRTIHWEWQRRLTDLVSPLELYQMQACWDSLMSLAGDHA